jgi:hypothetical protein
MKKIILLFACFIFASLYKVYPQQQTITDEDNRFSIDIPAGWVHGASKNAFVHMLICTDTVNLNEKLSISYCKSFYNLSKTYDMNKDAMKDLKNFKIDQEGEGELSGEKCKWFVFTFESNDGSVLMKGKQYTVKKSKSFVIQYILKEKRFDIMKETFEKMIATINLK